MSAPTEKYRPYSIELPNHEIRFALPQYISRHLVEHKVTENFHPNDQAFQKDGFRLLAAFLHDFKGPLWGGPYGSLKFHIIVQRVHPDYPKPVVTHRELQDYIEWKIGRGNNADNCLIQSTCINSIPAVCRAWNNIDASLARNRQDITIFSVPLGDQLFVDIGFTIIDWKNGKRLNKWRAKAEALQEEIENTFSVTSNRN